ncbi:MAG: HAD family hydrolase [Myxococcota bacterium]
MQGAAFFDLDRTLIPFNSGMRYARWEHRAGRLSTLRLAQSGLWLTLYHLALVDMTRAYEKAVALYRGIPAAELAARTREWFDAEIEGALVPAGRAAIDEHRAAGRRTVLLSSTSGWMAEVVTARWRLDHWLANVFPTDAAGFLTGRVERPLCYGPGKVDHARRWAAEHGVDLGASWFYTDSHSDLPMLEVVGHPHVVNPDPRLRLVARRRGWPVLRWDEAQGGRDVTRMDLR